MAMRPSRTKEVYEFVENGDLEIREDGTIWRRWRDSNNEHITFSRAEYKTANGYLQIHVYKNGERIVTSAHNLVWYHYTKEVPDKHIFVIHHKNKDKSDNRFTNLDKITHGTHNLIHPRKVWLDGKTVADEKVNEWHKKTVKTRKENHKNKALQTYRMVEIEHQHPALVAKQLGISKRTVYQHIADCIGEGVV